MREANVRFRVPPRLLILQMPRYGQQKIFDRIVPLEHIEITPLVHGGVFAVTVLQMYLPVVYSAHLRVRETSRRPPALTLM